MFGKNFSTTKGRFGDIKFQDENTPFVPQSPYAIAKLAAHHLVRNYREGYGVHGSCGILFNHESERRGENFVTRKITKWIGAFLKWIDETGYTIQELESDDFKTSEDHIINLEGSFPKLRLGNLDAKRDWGHAQDYVNAMWLMLQQDTADDYVIGTGETYSVRDFLDAAFNYVDIDDWESCVVVDPEFYRPAEVDYLLGIPKKAESVLGWHRDVSFKQLAERMVDSDVEKARLRRSGLQAVSS
jgi:GDPmannose 4,6-dehydratase